MTFEEFRSTRMAFRKHSNFCMPVSMIAHIKDPLGPGFAYLGVYWIGLVRIRCTTRFKTPGPSFLPMKRLRECERRIFDAYYIGEFELHQFSKEILICMARHEHDKEEHRAAQRRTQHRD